ncbi:FUSC family protein [Cryobacterium luteum]|uniref:FUSC family protein n=1 Tax=Cryobacterium luteum TaxID=1424661 RepID=UPI002106A21E|nr:MULTISPECIES: FUSC family protein [Cryobacterium]
MPGPPVAVLILDIALGQFGAEIRIGRDYGAALLFVTPLALTVVHLTSPVPVPALLVDRVLETVLGSVFALVIVLLVRARVRLKNRH